MSREANLKKNVRRRERAFRERRAAGDYLLPGPTTPPEDAPIVILMEYSISFDPIEEPDPGTRHMRAVVGTDHLDAVVRRGKIAIAARRTQSIFRNHLCSASSPLTTTASTTAPAAMQRMIVIAKPPASRGTLFIDLQRIDL